jgi:hypothetical protein
VKDRSENNLFIGANVLVDGKVGTIISIRNDNHFARVAFSDGEIIFAVSQEILLVRKGHHSKCTFLDCQGGCWDIFDE